MTLFARLFCVARHCAAGLLFCVFCLPAVGNGQPLASYTNIQRQVMVWDNGMIRKVDYLPPVLLKIGRSAIPYLDNSRNFKIYYGGGVRTINPGYTNTFEVTDNLVVFLNQRSLNVFDRGVTKNLTAVTGDYFVGDSVVLWHDDVRQYYAAYYNGEVYPIEDFLAAQGLTQVRVSDNVAAYNNYANQFRIFYHGNILAQEDYAVESFEVGRNTVAYVDVNRTLKIFHDGTTTTAENFPPNDYAVGDNLAAWNSSDGYFRVFYEDSIRTLGYFNAVYQVADNIVAFKDNSGYLKIFYKGNIYNIDNYYPEGFVAQYNSLAYTTRGGLLRVFTDGEMYDVTAAQLDSWSLNYDVVQYQIGMLFRIFYKGDEY